MTSDRHFVGQSNLIIIESKITFLLVYVNKNISL